VTPSFSESRTRTRLKRRGLAGNLGRDMALLLAILAYFLIGFAFAVPSLLPVAAA
jgi:hypothetical protein